MAIFDSTRISTFPARPPAGPGTPSVLLIDDSPANLAVMAAVLRPHFPVIEAHGGSEALTIIGQLAGQPVACVISDQRMPGLSGVELLTKVQALLPRAARIIVTGYMDVDAVVDSINQAEIDKFIAKPFDAHHFLAIVRAAVRRYEDGRAQDELALQLRQHVAALEANLARADAELRAARAEIDQRQASLDALAEQLRQLRR